MAEIDLNQRFPSLALWLALSLQAWRDLVLAAALAAAR